MRGKITKRAVDALKPGADGGELVLWDTELKGFGSGFSGAAPRATSSITEPASGAARRCAR